MNTLNVISCLDEQKSQYKPLIKSMPHGPKRFSSIYIDKDKLENQSIIRLKEYTPAIFVSDLFLSMAKEHSIKGVIFIKEGDMLAPTLVE